MVLQATYGALNVGHHFGNTDEGEKDNTLCQFADCVEGCLVATIDSMYHGDMPAVDVVIHVDMPKYLAGAPPNSYTWPCEARL